MEPLRRQVATGVLLLAGLAAGCVSLPHWMGPEQPPVETPCQVVATWNNQVVFSPDPVHNGDPQPGIAGRVYLFGPNDIPVAGDGALVVDLYDDVHTAAAAGARQEPTEEWRIDKDTLHRLLRKDAIGWGYTVFLPWSTYRPDTNRVHLRVRYVQPSGMPLYASSAPLTLNPEDSKGGFVPPGTGLGLQAAARAGIQPAAQAVAQRPAR